jgi:cell wall-associated NlpC family hydrolase
MLVPIHGTMSRRSPAWLALAVLGGSLFVSACASSGAVPRPFPVPGSAKVEPASPPIAAPAPVPAATDPRGDTSPRADNDPRADTYALLGTALSLRGVRYRDGGADPDGFDCSGFTQYVFAQYGLALPRAVREQFQAGTPVDADAVEAGDLLFFTTVAPGPTHVGIALGGDQFIHAPSSTGVVRVERVSSSYWAGRYLGARRIQ